MKGATIPTRMSAYQSFEPLMRKCTFCSEDAIPESVGTKSGDQIRYVHVPVPNPDFTVLIKMHMCRTCVIKSFRDALDYCDPREITADNCWECHQGACTDEFCTAMWPRPTQPSDDYIFNAYRSWNTTNAKWTPKHGNCTQARWTVMRLLKS